MGGNKHEIDGETYIVSDDVDLDELDLEKMVEKGDLSRAIEYVRWPPADPSKPKPTTAPSVPVERIWVTMDLKQGGTAETVVCACIVETMYVGDPLSHEQDPLAYYKVLVPRETALVMATLSMRSIAIGVPLFAERLIGSFGKLQEEVIFEKSDQMRLTRFHMWDTKLENAFIEVEFYVVPIQDGD